LFFFCVFRWGGDSSKRLAGSVARPWPNPSSSLFPVFAPLPLLHHQSAFLKDRMVHPHRPRWVRPFYLHLHARYFPPSVLCAGGVEWCFAGGDVSSRRAYYTESSPLLLCLFKINYRRSRAPFLTRSTLEGFFSPFFPPRVWNLWKLAQRSDLFFVSRVLDFGAMSFACSFGAETRPTPRSGLSMHGKVTSSPYLPILFFLRGGSSFLLGELTG